MEWRTQGAIRYARTTVITPKTPRTQTSHNLSTISPPYHRPNRRYGINTNTNQQWNQQQSQFSTTDNFDNNIMSTLSDSIKQSSVAVDKENDNINESTTGIQHDEDVDSIGSADANNSFHGYVEDEYYWTNVYRPPDFSAQKSAYYEVYNTEGSVIDWISTDDMKKYRRYLAFLRQKQGDIVSTPNDDGGQQQSGTEDTNAHDTIVQVNTDEQQRINDNNDTATTNDAPLTYLDHDEISVFTYLHPSVPVNEILARLPTEMHYNQIAFPSLDEYGNHMFNPGYHETYALQRALMDQQQHLSHPNNDQQICHVNPTMPQVEYPLHQHSDPEEDDSVADSSVTMTQPN